MHVTCILVLDVGSFSFSLEHKSLPSFWQNALFYITGWQRVNRELNLKAAALSDTEGEYMQGVFSYLFFNDSEKQTWHFLLITSCIVRYINNVLYGCQSKSCAPRFDIFTVHRNVVVIISLLTELPFVLSRFRTLWPGGLVGPSLIPHSDAISLNHAGVSNCFGARRMPQYRRTRRCYTASAAERFSFIICHTNSGTKNRRKAEGSFCQ